MLLSTVYFLELFLQLVISIENAFCILGFFLQCSSLYIFWVQESKVNIGVRNIFCVLEKAEKNWWKKLLRGDGKTPHYIKVDWDKWVDEDEDNGMPYV